MTEDYIEERKRDADHASRILNDDLITDFFDQYKEETLEKWKATNPNDSEGREYCWMMMKLLEEFQQHFNLFIQYGEFHNEQEQD